MMRKTILLGLCCAFASPAVSEERPITLALGEICQTTTSLVPCRSAAGLKSPGLMGAQSAAGFAVSGETASPSVIRLAEAKTPPDLQSRLKEYICELLGYDNCGATKVAATPEPDNNEAVIALPATTLSDYLKTREGWGSSEAKEVKAPLAKGAPESFAAASGGTGSTDSAGAAKDPVVHAAKERPLPELSDIPRSQLDGNLKKLFAERESWGTSPAKSTADPGGSKSAAAAGGVSKAATVTAPATGDLSAFLKLRESWGMMEASPVKAPLAKGATASFADTSGSDEAGASANAESAAGGLMGTADLSTYLAQRDTWGKGPAAKEVKAPLAKGAKPKLDLAKAQPQPKTGTVKPTIDGAADRPLPEMRSVAQADIVRARNALLKERESWGTEPSSNAGATVTGDLDAYLSRRDSWGTGPAAKEVKAPLAKGAKSKLDLAKAIPAPKTGEVQPTVNDTADRPLPDLTDVDSAKIKKSLASLLATRESWGTEPSPVSSSFTGDLDSYLARRDSWGTGPAAKKVAAPLAKGAPKKLTLAKALPTPVAGTAVATPDVERPIPQVADIPAAQVSQALSDLLAARESWGTEPSASSATVTGDLDAYLARRDRWGSAGESKTVKAPLAKGASKKLKLAKALPAPVATSTVTTPDVERPIPQVADIPAGQVSGALKELLATRESWGTEPSLSESAFAGDLDRYLARRDGWGAGTKAKPVKAPLAKGASRKLRLAKAPSGGGKQSEPIVHDAEDRPLPDVADVPQGEIQAAMADLLATREGWGTKPSQSTARIATGSTSGGTDDSGQQVAALGNAASTAPLGKQDCAAELQKLTSGRSILFANASAELDSNSNEFLDGIAQIIRRCDKVAVEIGGHTDSIGSARTNQRLSLARAQSVLDYLKKAGVETERLSAKGYGEEQPIASNADRESRAKNRRIEFKVR